MAERDYCGWCADESFDARSCTCPHDCGIDGCIAAIPPDWDEISRA